MVSVGVRAVLRRAAEVARPLEWPMVVLERAEAAVWRMGEGLVACECFFERGSPTVGFAGGAAEEVADGFALSKCVGCLGCERAVAADFDVKVEGPFA